MLPNILRIECLDYNHGISFDMRGSTSSSLYHPGRTWESYTSCNKTKPDLGHAKHHKNEKFYN